MNRREFLANALKLSALGVIPFSLFGETERSEVFPDGKTTIGRSCKKTDSSKLCRTK